ncbi:helix-turn-helix transcriptional regulator [Sphingopyxis sp.]|uniref:helix-turn-helix domain-containing protein n=1 Tax=Sphingopyxis sp. TaxID=1908224 RepID=UPI0010F5BC37|nr:helix-turn-helix domain-containing protein [Sphingopyxis sp.]MBR2173736.1 helix-turn-helix transcriptional regulator [Sphingopyxis sp.]
MSKNIETSKKSRSRHGHSLWWVKMANIFSEVIGSELFREEYFVSEIQARLSSIMEDKGISRAELARKLGVSRARVTQIFSDDANNFTIRLMFNVFSALEEEPIILTKQEYQRLKEKEVTRDTGTSKPFTGLSDQLIAELLKDKISFGGNETDRGAKGAANAEDWAKTGSNVVPFERYANG